MEANHMKLATVVALLAVTLLALQFGLDDEVAGSGLAAGARLSADTPRGGGQDVVIDPGSGFDWTLVTGLGPRVQFVSASGEGAVLRLVRDSVEEPACAVAVVPSGATSFADFPYVLRFGPPLSEFDFVVRSSSEEVIVSGDGAWIQWSCPSEARPVVEVNGGGPGELLYGRESDRLVMASEPPTFHQVVDLVGARSYRHAWSAPIPRGPAFSMAIEAVLDAPPAAYVGLVTKDQFEYAGASETPIVRVVRPEVGVTPSSTSLSALIVFSDLIQHEATWTRDFEALQGGIRASDVSFHHIAFIAGEGPS